MSKKNSKVCECVSCGEVYLVKGNQLLCDDCAPEDTMCDDEGEDSSEYSF